MRIRDWPAAERPREKLLTQGPGALSTAELLALLIGHGREGLTAVDMAREAMQHYGGIRDLLDAPIEDLLLRVNRRKPSLSSRRLIAWLRGGWAICRRSAAL